MAKYTYNCGNNKVTCQPIPVTLTKGYYRLELWGAQGGNATGLLGGYGGYSKGIIYVKNSIKLYLFIGASGIEWTSGLTQNAFNGGGKGTCISREYNSASGGGATDIRTSLDLKSRIIVAGGGGGASYHIAASKNIGGSGGGLHGQDGFDGIYGTSVYNSGKGGKNNDGGISSVQKGTLGYGGNQTGSRSLGSGGGGGYYGGGSGYAYGASGGGGSGYVSTLLKSPLMITGNTSMPNFYTGRMGKIGHVGDGAIKITKLIFASSSTINKDILPLAAMLLLCTK